MEKSAFSVFGARTDQSTAPIRSITNPNSNAVLSLSPILIVPAGSACIVLAGRSCLVVITNGGPNGGMDRSQFWPLVRTSHLQKCLQDHLSCALGRKKGAAESHLLRAATRDG